MNNHSMTENKAAISRQQQRIKRVNTIKGIAFLLVVLSFIGLSISNVSASELNSQASVSYGGKKDFIDDQTRNLVIAQNSNSGVYDQIIGKAKRQTREQVIADKQIVITDKSAKGFEKSLAPGTARYYVPEFNIYDATTFLEDDIDGDGYYRTFGVVFDVDVYNPNGDEESVIYAELYLSTDGVNWEHYYSTDDFLISGNNPDDQFEVITTLAEGYNTQNYDVLIDIYEVGYTEIVATYSSDDNNALYALPLESAEYDQVYIEEIVVHGGSQSTFFLLFTLAMLFVRKVRAS
ncbi:choice-of-anchor H family protein [Pseudocolwellia sp. HL-MZ19]|uniref:choice-of-anchor H family protein n=1 Tax=unclassified Pseudocolwellia TaxID=2848178 RepID=UPI003CF17459